MACTSVKQKMTIGTVQTRRSGLREHDAVQTRLMTQGKHDAVQTRLMTQGKHDAVQTQLMTLGKHDAVQTQLMTLGKHDAVQTQLMTQGKHDAVQRLCSENMTLWPVHSRCVGQAPASVMRRLLLLRCAGFRLSCPRLQGQALTLLPCLHGAVSSAAQGLWPRGILSCLQHRFLAWTDTLRRRAGAETMRWTQNTKSFDWGRDHLHSVL